MRRASVIIPASNEALVIERCIEAILQDARPEELELIVVCNGCSDATAVLASRHDGVRIVELQTASKTAALNAGDEAASLFPRFYVDADVEISTGAIRRVAEVLNSDLALCAAPTPTFELASSSFAVRAFYRTWARLPFLMEAPVGNGVYALSRDGRARFKHFPPVISDDLFVRNLFTKKERATVQDAAFTIHAPRSIRGLLQMRTRVYRGNSQLRRQFPAISEQRGRPAYGVWLLMRNPSTTLPALIYISINLLARIIAQVRVALGRGGWERDESARRAASRP